MDIKISPKKIQRKTVLRDYDVKSVAKCILYIIARSYFKKEGTKQQGCLGIYSECGEVGA
ncbi:MAG: hypothetical protein K8R34_08985 [Methanosarcinales archaeon]|nr:hypothetical protein [Methanosarcinales archaeon]MCD4798125.1 hypothetical protein [Methanosarcinales archaeon]